MEDEQFDIPVADIITNENQFLGSNELFLNAKTYLQDHGLNLLIAFGALIIGWVLLSLLAYIIRSRFLKTLKLNYYFEKMIFRFDIEKFIARLLFFVGLIFLFKITAQLASLTEVDNFFDSVLTLTGVLSLLAAKALIPLIAALVFAWGTKKGISLIGEKFHLDEKIGSKLDAGEAVTFSFTKSLSEMGYGIVFLLFLPAILSGLGLRDLGDPIQSMIKDSLSFIPKLFGAAVILAVGWFVAKIIKEVITGLLASLGVDSAFQKIQIEQMTGGVKFSKLGGTIVYAVILILVFIEALKKLSLNSITEPVVNVLNQFFAVIPDVLFAGFLIFITYFIARIVSQIVTQVLEGVGFNNILIKLGFEKASFSRPKSSPSHIVGIISFYALMFFATIEALDQIGLNSISEIVKEVTLFSGQVIFGLVIFGVGLFVSNIVSKTIQSSSAPNSNLLAFIARTGILILVGAMALKRMGLADEIVNIAFGLILGSLALGTGIAFGLGGKDQASEIVKDIRAKFK